MNEEKQKQARKGLILVVATLIYTKQSGKASVAQAFSITEGNVVAQRAFDLAEAFADEAEKRGYDVASIAAGGLLP